MIAPLAPTSASSAPADPAAAPRAASCAHCGLPVPAQLGHEGADPQFCCAGCQTVYSVVHSCGLDGYYRLRQATQEAIAPAVITGKSYQEFDDPAFEHLYVQAGDDGESGPSMASTEMVLEGLHCAACVWLIEKLPEIIPGVLESRLNYRGATVHLAWDPSLVKLSAIARTLDSLGYRPHPARDMSNRKLQRLEDRRFMVRIAVAGAAAGNVMLLAMALYSGEFAFMQAEFESLFRWLSMALGVVALAWPGSIFFRGAWASLRMRTVHLDLPIALGLGAGGLWGSINVIRGTGDIYFDSLTGLIFFLLCARWVQHRQQRRAADAVELLYSLTPSSARRVDDGEPCDVPVEALVPGDVVEVRAGESIPVDGIIVQGSSRLDQSLLSGESVPISVGEGDSAHAGAVNIAAAIQIRVCQTGEATRVGRLMRMVSDCAARKAPLVHMADRLAGWFVAALVTLAAITLLIWWRTGPQVALDHAIALMIVACPCGLGLATPLAMTVSIGRAARREILIKGGDAIERFSRRAMRRAGGGTIFLDKTGTITAGRTHLVRWVEVSAPCSPSDPKLLAHAHSADNPLRGTESSPLQSMVAALESHSSHPIARALAADASADHDPAFSVDDVVQTIGGGIEGRVDGQHLVVGSLAFVLERTGRRQSGVDGHDQITLDRLDPLLADALSSARREALTPVLIARDGIITALAALGDPIREDSAAVVQSLLRRGWKVGVLSGDHPDVARGVGAAIGLPAADCRGGVSPEQKLAAVQEAMKHGLVVMVGDGVNDAAALASASVGIAVHGGAEASLAAADVYLNRPGLGPILELFDGADRTVRTIRRNLVISLGYNVLAASLAMTGLITPILGAIMMPISSLTVLTFSFKSRTFGD